MLHLGRLRLYSQTFDSAELSCARPNLFCPQASDEEKKFYKSVILVQGVSNTKKSNDQSCKHFLGRSSRFGTLS